MSVSNQTVKQFLESRPIIENGVHLASHVAGTLIGTALVGFPIGVGSAVAFGAATYAIVKGVNWLGRKVERYFKEPNDTFGNLLVSIMFIVATVLLWNKARSSVLSALKIPIVPFVDSGAIFISYLAAQLLYNPIGWGVRKLFYAGEKLVEEAAPIIANEEAGPMIA